MQCSAVDFSFAAGYFAPLLFWQTKKTKIEEKQKRIYLKLNIIMPGEAAGHFQDSRRGWQVVKGGLLGCWADRWTGSWGQVARSGWPQ